MADRLVTIATFDLAGKARLALNVLEAAGIKAVLSDEALVSMDWLLSTAVGGIKLQVWEADAERAVGLLEEALAPGEPLAEGEDVPGEEEFDETGTRDRVESDRADTAAVPPTTPDDAPAPVGREQHAHRAFFAAVVGVVFPLLLFFSIYSLLMVWWDEGELSEKGRRRAWWAVAITLPGLIGWWCWLFYFPEDFF
jgi:hypothetical protein